MTGKKKMRFELMKGNPSRILEQRAMEMLLPMFRELCSGTLEVLRGLDAKRSQSNHDATN